MCNESPNLFQAYYQQLVELAPLQKAKMMAMCNWSNTKFYEMMKLNSNFTHAHTIRQSLIPKNYMYRNMMRSFQNIY